MEPTNLDHVLGLIAGCLVSRGKRPNRRNAVHIVTNPGVGGRRGRGDEAGVQILQWTRRNEADVFP